MSASGCSCSRREPTRADESRVKTRAPRTIEIVAAGRDTTVAARRPHSRRDPAEHERGRRGPEQCPVPSRARSLPRSQHQCDQQHVVEGQRLLEDGAEQVLLCRRTAEREPHDHREAEAQRDSEGTPGRGSGRRPVIGQPMEDDRVERSPAGRPRKPAQAPGETSRPVPAAMRPPPSLLMHPTIPDT